jgi:hypothetical protein
MIYLVGMLISAGAVGLLYHKKLIKKNKKI